MVGAGDADVIGVAVTRAVGVLLGDGLSGVAVALIAGVSMGDSIINGEGLVTGSDERLSAYQPTPITAITAIIMVSNFMVCILTNKRKISRATRSK